MMPSTVIVVALGSLPTGRSSSSSTTSPSETACVYDATSGAKLMSFKQEGACGGVAANAKSILTTRAGKGTAAMFAWGKEMPVWKFGCVETLESIAFSHDGIHVVGGGLSGRIYVWESYTGQMLCSWSGHFRKILSLRFTDDDSVLISASDDATVKMWNMSFALMNEQNPQQSLIRTTSANKIGVSGIACGAGGVTGKVAASSLDHSCRVFLGASGKEIFCATFSVALACVALDITENHVYAGGIDGIIYVGELSSGKTSEMVGHQAAVRTIQQYNSSSMPCMISGSDDGTIKSWDCSSKSLLKTIKIDGGIPICQLVIVEIDKDFERKPRGLDQPALKKVKEDEREDRWLNAFCDSSSSQRSMKMNASETKVPTKNGESMVGASSEARWSAVATALYSMAAENVLNKLVGKNNS